MKCKLIMFLVGLLLIGSPLSAKQYFLAPDGNDRNKGTFEEPFGSLDKAVSMLAAGDTCYIRGGEYFPTSTVNITATGTKDARICLFAYNNEKPIFNFKALPDDDNARGIYHKIGANYWHYNGLTICNAGDNGMKMEGSFTVIERCTFHSNKDTGLQLGFGKGSNGENTRNPDYHFGRYNIMLNCDSYNNFDAPSGGDADGFAAKLFPGPGNEFHGCRSWYNSDDGWDFYYVYFPYVVNNCWTMKNGYSKGNGNGFKMGGGKQGGDMSNGAHLFTNCIAIDNQKKGFDQNNHAAGTYMLNCVSVRNGTNYGFNNDAPVYGEWYLRNCIGFSAGERNHQFQAASTVNAQNCSWMTFDGCDVYSDRNKVPNPSGSGTITPKIGDYTAEFKSLTYDDAIAERQADGSLPQTFGRLKAGSKFIDAGVNVTNFLAEDTKYPKYSKTVTIPFSGANADMGAFEFGIDQNDYELVMPENDGSVPDETPVIPDDEWTDDEGNTYSEVFFADWYPFQEAVLPDSLNFIVGGTIAHDFAYPAEFNYSNGSLIIKKETSIELSLPSLCNFQGKFYATGTREIAVRYKTQGQTSWTSTSVSKSKGAYTLNIAEMVGKSKSPITIQIDNTKSGDLRISEILISGYKKEGTSSIEEGAVEDFDIYQTETALIVYGEIASLKVYNLSGRAVASSENMQVVDIASIPNGVYVVLIKDKNGKTASRKFIK